MFYLMFSVFMFILGMFMSVSPALVILTPILAPAVKALGIDPVHFGVVFVIWMCIGTVTPPFGTDLFIACGVAKIGASEGFKKVWPFIIIYVVCVILVMAFPSISLALPRLLGFV
jgi:TRAP-type C4-dicarboxylate transport system permease large subunit